MTKRLKALKDIYVNGRIVRRGQFYSADEIVAKHHIRHKYGEDATHPFTRSVKGPEKNKIAGPSQNKQEEKSHVSDPKKTGKAGGKAGRRPGAGRPATAGD
jgi:hypothetical protein